MSVNSVAEDIKDRIVAGGFATFPPPSSPSANQFGISKNMALEKPDRLIAVYAFGGPQPERVMLKSIKPQETKTFQIRIRGSRRGSEAEVVGKLDDIVYFLEELARFDVVATDSGDPDLVYYLISRTSDALFLKTDENARMIWTVNMKAKRKRKS